MEVKTKNAECGVTFKVADVQPKRARDVFKTKAVTELIQLKEQDKLLLGSSVQNAFATSNNNHFAGCVIDAYCKHIALSIKPDHVWAAIIIAFARFVNFNAEKMRSIFVAHEGKQELCVYTTGSMRSADYGPVVNEICQQIQKHIKKEIYEWTKPEFTTTTERDQVVCQFVLMGCMKEYFSYEICFECGIPQITLEGCKADWENILNRLQSLKQYGIHDFDKWFQVLEYVIGKFIDAFAGQVDLLFWNSMCDQFGGSGTISMTGWFLAFVAFDKKGKYILKDFEDIKMRTKFNTNNFQDIFKGSCYGMLDIDKIPACEVEIPVKINDHGMEYETIFKAGFMYGIINSQQLLSPQLDWALIDVTKVNQLKKEDPTISEIKGLKKVAAQEVEEEKVKGKKNTKAADKAAKVFAKINAGFEFSKTKRGKKISNGDTMHKEKPMGKRSFIDVQKSVPHFNRKKIDKISQGDKILGKNDVPSEK